MHVESAMEEIRSTVETDDVRQPFTYEELNPTNLEL